MKKVLKEVKEYSIIIGIAFVVAILLNTLLFSISNVKETSMEPTLIEGDTVIVGRVGYKFGQPTRGDIVVVLYGNDLNMGYFSQVGRLVTDVFNKFRGIENPNRLVKRVIGLPGDVINIEGGVVYVNDVIIDNEFMDMTSVTTDERQHFDYPVTVPQDQVFVLGDHREVSRDSRSFGFVDIENIEGKVVFRIFPFNKFGGMY